MTDTRSNEQIVQDALWGAAPGLGLAAVHLGDAALAALADAGRLVTPEHDAQVRAEQTEIVTGYIDDLGWNDLTRAEALREIERRLAQAENGATS